MDNDLGCVVGLFTRAELGLVKERALRKGAWFRVLNRAERAILDLTIRCVERVRSLRLAGIVKAIVSKLEDAMKSRVVRMMETFGRPLAQRLSRIALNWGNRSAERWAEDSGFIQYLAVAYMNTPAMFKC